jgi:3D (Asp-Asp-Asp) domain-containing protein
VSCDAGTPEDQSGAQADSGLGSGAFVCAALCALALATAQQARGAEPEPAACAPRTMRITFYTCGEGYPPCLTKRGNMPLPFRTVAVGDLSLLGRWLFIEDLGGWVHATDIGGALKRDSIDVFIGESRMVPHARRLGVQYWTMRPCGPDPEPTRRAVTAGTAGDARANGQP